MRSRHLEQSVASLDPAIRQSNGRRSGNFDTQVEINASEIYVFDFDGVISSNFEDQVYRVEATARDIAATALAATRLRISCEGMEFRYQRHLVYQAALALTKSPMLPGPGFFMAQEASRVGKLFVLTARSGWFAVERCLAFLKTNGIIPIETFHVGRVGKVAQMKLICDQFPDKIINFIEDSEEHLLNVMSSNVGRVNPILVCEEHSAPRTDDSVITHYFDTLNALFKLPEMNFDVSGLTPNVIVTG